MLFEVDYWFLPELKVILEQWKNHKHYVRHPNLCSNFPLEFCFLYAFRQQWDLESQWCQMVASFLVPV